MVRRVGRWSAGRRTQLWLDALYVWCATRALILVITYVAPALRGSARVGSEDAVVGPLRRWVVQDGAQIASIAQHGYGQPGNATYLPLLPLLEHLLAPLTGGDYGLAGLVIANLSFLGALVVLRELLGRDFDAEVARRTLLYLAIFPFAFSFFAPLNESLYLLLSAGVFLALRGRHWWLAGLLGSLAMLTSYQALALLVPFVVEVMAAMRYGLARWWHILWAALIPAGLAAYAIYLYRLFGDPLAFARARNRSGLGLNSTLRDSFASARALASRGKLDSAALGHLVRNVSPVLIVGAACLALAVVAARRLPVSYGSYVGSLLLLAVVVWATSTTVAQQSGGRYIAAVFPVFVLLALWGRRPRVHDVLIVSEVGLLTLLTLQFL